MAVEVLEELGKDVRVRYTCCGREDVMRRASMLRHQGQGKELCKFCAAKMAAEKKRKEPLIRPGVEVAGVRILDVKDGRVLVQCLNCGAKAWVTRPNIYGRLRNKTSVCRVCR